MAGGVARDSTGRFVWREDVNVEKQVNDMVNEVVQKNHEQTEFLQAFREVVESLMPVFKRNPKYINIMKVIAEPERAIIFRVPWMDDNGVQRTNRGYRVQFSSVLGPYKGGLRFHPTVNLGVLKFLGFEQIFKNALTTLPMGGGKGGSDFDPKGKSDSEVMRFCQSFMTELARHIGSNVDVPAGDIGVGGREIGYLFGQYKRLTKSFEGVLTGKDPNWGGSLIRPEATGYGAVYFAENWYKKINQTMKGKRATISGSGNVAQYTAELLLKMGAIPVTLSDSSGYIYAEKGITREMLDAVEHLKNVKRGRIEEITKQYTEVKFFPGERPWGVACDMAFPSATQNEIDGADATKLAENKCQIVVEGANMPSTKAAIEVYKKTGIVYCPGKAANAGGVSVSGLEMTQNSLRYSWSREEVDEKLQHIMKTIFDDSMQAAADYGLENDLQAGANIAGFLKVADAMIQQGCV